MNVNMAARHVHRSRRTLYNWMPAGTLPYTTSNGSRHVRLEDVRQLVEKRKPLVHDVTGLKVQGL